MRAKCWTEVFRDTKGVHVRVDEIIIVVSVSKMLCDSKLHGSNAYKWHVKINIFMCFYILNK